MADEEQPGLVRDVRANSATQAQRHPISAIVWVAVVGVLSFVLGTLEAGYARDWDHVVGETVATIAVLLGACYIAAAAYYASARRRARREQLPEAAESLEEPRPPRVAPVLANLRRCAPAVLALDVFILLLALVHVKSAEHLNGAQFPDGCPLGPSDPGCYRVAYSHASESAEPVLSLAANRHDVQQALLRWVHAEARTEVLESVEYRVHIQGVSRLWGFADDLFVRLSCADGDTAVEAQGQLRLGHGDLGVNKARIDRLFDFLRAREDKSDLAPSTCGDGEGETLE